MHFHDHPWLLILACLLASSAIPLIVGTRSPRDIGESRPPNEPQPFPLDALPDSVLARLFPHYDRATQSAFYRADRRHRGIARDHFQQRFRELVSTFPRNSPSKWYHATLSVLRSGKFSAEQFRWILHAGSASNNGNRQEPAGTFTDMQLNRLFFRCVDLHWQKAQELLFATGRISQVAQQSAKDGRAYMAELARTIAAYQRNVDNHDLPPSPAFLQNTYFLDGPVGQRGRNMLTEAAARNDTALVTALLEEGADPNNRNHPRDETPLMLAAVNGNEPMARQLLAYRANVHPIAQDGRTALHYASIGNSPHIVQLLLDFGSNVDAQDGSGSTAIMEAAVDGYEQVIEVLLRAEPAPRLDSACKLRGMTALLHAIAGNHLETARLLVLAGASVEPQGRFHWPPLEIAVRDGHLGMARMLIEDGRAPVNAPLKSTKGWPLLAIALQENSAEMVQLLLDAHADVTMLNEEGASMLEISHYGYPLSHEILRSMLHAGADVLNAHGRRALSVFILHENVAVVKALLDAGMDVKRPDADGTTPMQHAKHTRNREIRNVLERARGTLSMRQRVRAWARRPWRRFPSALRQHHALPDGNTSVRG